MKLFAKKSIGRLSQSNGGFTLVEMIVTSTIFLVIVVAAMLSVQLYGLRIYNLATSKVQVTTAARESINDIRDRVRSAQQVYIGNYTNSTFTAISSGLNQIGNALQIFPATNTTAANAIVFYMDTVNTSLKMVSNGVVSVSANFVTNYYCFNAEDYRGNNLTNFNQNNPVIGVTLMFNQLAFPYGLTNAYNYYQLRTHISMRVKN